MRTSKITEVRKLVSKLQKAQQAAEDALDLYERIGHWLDHLLEDVVAGFAKNVRKA